MKLELRSTGDGSSTLYNSWINETYHSIHGARQEALHVFIENGLKKIESSSINILEVGLGTGFNAMLTFLNRKDKIINYVGLEPYPVPLDLLEEYIIQNVQNDNEREIWQSLMLDKISKDTMQFNFEKCVKPLLDFDTKKSFDLIYFDAFAPNKQEEMWVPAIFEKLYAMARPNARIVTYCAQGQFKRNLRQAGFLVQTLPGPPGKREMTVGIKT